MVYTQSFNEKGIWKTMCLTEEEVEQVIQEHKKISNKILKECLEDCLNSEIVSALFESRCPKLYTLMQNRLQDKIKAYANNRDFIDQPLELIKKLKEEKI